MHGDVATCEIKLAILGVEFTLIVIVEEVAVGVVMQELLINLQAIASPFARVVLE